MIFEALNKSAEDGELLLVDGGMCRWHLRRDNQLTIREIIVDYERQGRGIGKRMLECLKETPGATSIVARCPGDLPANGWYERMGFVQQSTSTTKTGRTVITWQLQL